ncbi:hypothetical protein HCJ93_08465 [Streptomyces sp. SBST2-5]|jgi:hypothetical protein|uniref:Uncharacterized protein n=1 Tax=Streptomyces composti TaxID=2720025 RepID=A0ABX1A132_9ACTN|nr:hypothetical protein [Streptomyces composti]NJP50104.1 hypothetical protein [Streptomyces composti]
MNALELRYAIFKALSGLNQPASIRSVRLVNATLTQPEWFIEVITDDPRDPDDARQYRVKVEEIV